MASILDIKQAYGIQFLKPGNSPVSTGSSPLPFTLVLHQISTRHLPLPTSDPIWRKVETHPKGHSTQTLYSESGVLRLDIDCQGKGSFIYPKDGSIHAYWSPDGTNQAHYLLGIGIALWFEKRKITCLHGNTLSCSKGAIAILGHSGAGKSTLTTALLNSGFSFLGDDLLAPIPTNEGWAIYPGTATIRIWPDSLQHSPTNFSKDALTQIHKCSRKQLLPIEPKFQQSDASAPTPLKAIYILDRIDSSNEPVAATCSLSPAKALIELVSNSLAGEILKPIGTEKERLATLAQMAQQIDLRKLRYRSGFQYLPQVSSILRRDFESVISKKLLKA